MAASALLLDASGKKSCGGDRLSACRADLGRDRAGRSLALTLHQEQEQEQGPGRMAAIRCPRRCDAARDHGQPWVERFADRGQCHPAGWARLACPGHGRGASRRGHAPSAAGVGRPPARRTRRRGSRNCRQYAWPPRPTRRLAVKTTGPADPLARAANLERDWWTPTAGGYLEHVSKARRPKRSRRLHTGRGAPTGHGQEGRHRDCDRTAGGGNRRVACDAWATGG